MIALTGTAHYLVQAIWITGAVGGTSLLLDRAWRWVHHRPPKPNPYEPPETYGLPSHVRPIHRPHDWR